jgi:uncharacterized protein (DUF849 family)
MAKKPGKVIITCAITGAIHTPTLSDALPYKPADIAQTGYRGRARPAPPSCTSMRAIRRWLAHRQSGGVSHEFLPRIHGETDAVINLTTGGSPEMTVEERLAGALRFRPGNVLAQHGVHQFRISRHGGKNANGSFPGRSLTSENSEGFIFRNTFKDVARIYGLMADFGTRYEHECYDIGHLYNLAYFLDKGLAKPPLVRSKRVRHPGRHRSGAGQCGFHAPDRRPALRQ